MDWCSTENKVDCGVFVMRHMETYKGEEIKKWKCGFSSEMTKQKKQLKMLRFKYAVKVLLCDDNDLKQKITDEVSTFNKLSEAEKKDLEDLAKSKIKFRQDCIH